MSLFSNPEAFWLIPVVILILWKSSMVGGCGPLRILLLFSMIMAWANPRLNRIQPGVDVWVLLDQSESVQQFSAMDARETERLLRENKGPHDRLFFLDMAEEVFLRDPLAPEVMEGKRDATRIGHAINMALSQRDSDRAARLLYIGDGFATDPLDRAGERLLKAQLPLDLRLTTPELSADVVLEDLEVPVRVRPGEPFLVEARVSGPAGTNAEVILFRDGVEVNRRNVSLTGGRERLRWASEMAGAGSAQYAVSVEAEGDSVLGNNSASAWVEAGGGNRVLLLSPYADDPIAMFLRQEGVDVDLVSTPQEVTAGSLSGVGAVWIHNVHASRLPRDFQEALGFFVREQGGGLVMVGGRSSFGSGGYHESPVDPLLPVTMELKEEDRKLSVALAIVMDRSGSMSAGAGGGRTKMDLANAGAARAIELLGSSDSVAVFAVDTQPHTIIPLSRVGESRGQLLSIVRRIQSAGGGIYVFNGLEGAWNELKNAPQPQKHIILFADAADAEQPEGVGPLIKEMIGNNTTVSVIALGTDTDPDAPFLEQISVDGQGRLFFNADASTLPAVFAQETVSVARSAFLEQPTGTDPRPDWRELSAVIPEWPSVVDGYNLNYLREEASASLVTTDEYVAPLVAHWQQGLGRSAAVAMPLGGPFSETMRGWPDVSGMVRTLNRWVMREEWPPGLRLRTSRFGDTLRTTLYADQEWQERFATEPPVLMTTSEISQSVTNHRWRRMEPGVLETDVNLKGISRLRGAIRIGNQALPFGPVSGQPGSEWRFDREQVNRLKALSLASGGSSLTNLSDAWIRPPQQVQTGTRPLWLWACFALFLVEAFRSRLGGERIQVARSKSSERTLEKPLSPKNEKPTKDQPVEFKERSAFRKARRK